MFFFLFSTNKEEAPDNEQEQSNEDVAEVACTLMHFEAAGFKQSTLVLVSFPFVCFQEGSDHDEAEDADAEEDEYDLAGDETSEDSDSEELDEKGDYSQPQLFFTRPD